MGDEEQKQITQMEKGQHELDLWEDNASRQCLREAAVRRYHLLDHWAADSSISEKHELEAFGRDERNVFALGCRHLDAGG